MTLFKQITLSISTLFVILMLIVLANDLSRVGRLQQVQLHSTAQDTAATLGAAIGRLPGTELSATIATLIEATLDRGYYRRIEFVTTDGLSIEQRIEPTTDRVPAWFANLMALQPEAASMPVTRDGTPLGRLNVEVHPGAAYGILYEQSRSLLLSSLVLLGAGLALIWLLVRHLMRPLQRLQRQADAIHRNQFVEDDFEPPTAELRSVAGAMNLMVTRVQGIFEEQERTLSRYRQLLYRDQLTNLGNRRYLLEQLQQSMSENSNQFNCMALIKILDYEQLREQHGYEACNELVQIVADLLRKAHAGHSASRLSRFNEDEFAFLGATDGNAASDYLEALFEQFRRQVGRVPELTGARLVAGVCNIQADDEVSRILARVDYSLSQASNRGPFSIERQIAANLDLPQGKMQWRGWLDTVIDKQRLFLVGQLAISNDRIPIQRELFVRARGDGDQVIPAAVFIPMAASLGMSLDIDRAVFRLITSAAQLDRRIPLAINLSAAFFELAEAQEDFNHLLEHCRQNDMRLCIEASHNALLRSPAMCSQVSERVRSYGHSFGIDNLDFGQSLQLLQSGEFDYVKVNARVLHDLVENEMTASYQALRTLGDTLDLRIIAVAVDSQQVHDNLRELGIENMQGNLLGEHEVI
jgi:EAL domain-containing protein (putative c-di-GMP-specific phosphodiesterase class I)/GGDEF domain-containing protein